MPPPPPVDAPPLETAVVVTDAAPPSAVSVDAALTLADAIPWSADPKSARAIGHTSIVFKCELTNGKKAVFKPASKRGPVRYRGEIAAYRLGVALGLTLVPRAFYKQIEGPVLARALAGSGAGETQLEADVVRSSGDIVKGAVIPWIDDLDFLPLEREPLATAWKAWLRAGTTIPEEKKALAAQISTLVAFDYVTGNWDRWSGGNVGLSKTTGDLLFIDNDGAFFEVVPKDALARNERLLRGVDRFSRAFVTALRALDDAALAKAIGEEVEGRPLLSEKALAGVSARRAALLAIVDAKPDALTFP